MLKYDEWELGEDNRFKEGDTVWFKGRIYGKRWIRDGYAIGTVKKLFQIIPFDCIEYEVVAEGDDDRDYYVVDEDDMGIININDIEFDDEAVLGKPLFQIGDVVEVTDELNKIQVVREIIIAKTGEKPKYMYEVSPLDSDDKVCAYGEASLELQYHDSAWEEYFTKHTQNILPGWRGELYNYDIFRESFGFLLTYEYCNDTLPPDRLKYILDEYSIKGRIDTVMIPCKNIRIFEKIFNLGRKELYDMAFSIIGKINNRNACDIDPDFKSKVSDRRKFRFTELELSLVSEVDKRDFSLENYRAHYPVEMTNLQIMQAVKEAYSTARQVGMRKIAKARFKRYLWDTENEIDPVKGSALYEGVSKEGLVIRFWYNFDLNRIETAYPIQMDRE